MTLFLGLCGADKNPYHPEHISRVNVEIIRWRWQRSPEPWSVDMVNTNTIDFHVKQGPIWGGRKYICFFELFMDIEPCTPPIPLKREMDEARAGDIIRLAPGALVVTNNFAKHLVRA